MDEEEEHLTVRRMSRRKSDHAVSGREHGLAHEVAEEGPALANGRIEDRTNLECVLRSGSSQCDVRMHLRLEP
jgi:hypothetical protein